MSAYRNANATVSAYSAAAVTPSDSTTLLPTRALFIGGAGNVKVDMADTGTAVTFTNVQAGTILPIQVVKVYSTDTTATDIVALF